MIFFAGCQDAIRLSGVRYRRPPAVQYLILSPTLQVNGQLLQASRAVEKRMPRRASLLFLSFCHKLGFDRLELLPRQ